MNPGPLSAQQKRWLRLVSVAMAIVGTAGLVAGFVKGIVALDVLALSMLVLASAQLWQCRHAPTRPEAN
jgi:hypothetical protein